MSKTWQLFKRVDAERKVAHAKASRASIRGLEEAELDQVAAAGGNPASSGGSVED
jgi:hypothetical protein